MSRASRARRVAQVAAFGGGGLTFAGCLGVAVMAVEARLARRWIGQPFGVAAPRADGLYGDPRHGGSREPLDLVMLGDSSADGLGVTTAGQTPGAIIANGLASASRRPVRLTNLARVGAQSSDLADQVDRLLEMVPSPDVAVVLVGGNDVTHRVRVPVSVRFLAATVTRLREVGCEVVVGTCPDLGTVEPIVQPLRTVARRWSRELAAAQTVAVVEAGGRTVSLGDLLGPEFALQRHEMFSADRFHPSAVGYAQMADALLPSVVYAAGYAERLEPEHVPGIHHGQGVAPVSQAAAMASDDPGTEVSGTDVGGDERGPFGRWATLLRRGRGPQEGVAEEPVAEELGAEEPVEADRAGGALTSR